MTTQPGLFLQKGAIVLGIALVCGLIGLIIPQLFNRDVGGVLASELLGIAGLVVGVVLAAIIIRRRFD